MSVKCTKAVERKSRVTENVAIWLCVTGEKMWWFRGRKYCSCVWLAAASNVAHHDSVCCTHSNSHSRCHCYVCLTSLVKHITLSCCITRDWSRFGQVSQRSPRAGSRVVRIDPAPFPGRMSYKATKPGLICLSYLSMFLLCCYLLGPLFMYCYISLVYVVSFGCSSWVVITCQVID